MDAAERAEQRQENDPPLGRTRPWQEVSDLRARLARNEAALADRLNDRHPARPFRALMAELEGQPSSEWVAIVPTQIDDHANITTGRLVARAQTRAALHEHLRPLRAANPDLSVLVVSSGREATGSPPVHG